MKSTDPNENMGIQVRRRAADIIKFERRPLAVLEIKEMLRKIDPILWRRTTTRCSDYVRVILSLTDGDLVKYRCLYSLPGIDRRATFYGLPGTQYNPDKWEKIVNNRVPKKKETNQQSQAETKENAFEEPQFQGYDFEALSEFTQEDETWASWRESAVDKQEL